MRERFAGVGGVRWKFRFGSKVVTAEGVEVIYYDKRVRVWLRLEGVVDEEWRRI